MIRSSDQINESPVKEERIKRFHFIYKTNSIEIKRYDNTKITLDSKTVWGVQDKDGTLFRNFNRELFRIEEKGKIIIYSHGSRGFRSRVVKRYYFSKDFNSPLFYLDMFNFVEQFNDNTCIMRKLKQKFREPYDYTAWDNKKRSFRITQLVNECE